MSEYTFSDAFVDLHALGRGDLSGEQREKSRLRLSDFLEEVQAETRAIREITGAAQ
ncbi:hypothetical protein [uncultured Halomonas sp.]|uniref:hypothetical protein n=1 Tax=uncultured Halomonas sp. TaxID=173971 RepID=UPI002604A5A1|nr:hypothetical protein [uncultured Halomonas sp.]